MNLKVNHLAEGNKHYLEVSGELDAYTAKDLRGKLMPLTENNGNTVIVDLSGLDYMDSTGLGVFVGALKSSKNNGSKLILRNMTDRVRRLFEITGLDEIITFQDDNVRGEVR